MVVRSRQERGAQRREPVAVDRAGLAEQGGDVALDRPDREDEPRGDLRVGPVLRERDEDVPLARRQAGDAGGARYGGIMARRDGPRDPAPTGPGTEERVPPRE